MLLIKRMVKSIFSTIATYLAIWLANLPLSIRVQEPVSQKSRNFAALFRVPQFPLYLRNAEVLSNQTSQSSWCFLQ